MLYQTKKILINMSKQPKNIVLPEEQHYIARIVRYHFYKSIDSGSFSGKLKSELDKAISKNISKLLKKYRATKGDYTDIREFFKNQKITISISIPLGNLRDFPEESTSEKILNLCREVYDHWSSTSRNRWTVDGMFHWGERMVNEMRKLGATDEEFIFDQLNADIRNLGLIWKTGVTPETMAARHLKLYRSVSADLTPENVPQRLIDKFKEELKEERAKVELEPEWLKEVDEWLEKSTSDEKIIQYIKDRKTPKYVMDDIVAAVTFQHII